MVACAAVLLVQAGEGRRMAECGPAGFFFSFFFFFFFPFASGVELLGGAGGLKASYGGCIYDGNWLSFVPE